MVECRCFRSTSPKWKHEENHVQQTSPPRVCGVSVCVCWCVGVCVYVGVGVWCVGVGCGVCVGVRVCGCVGVCVYVGVCVCGCVVCGGVVGGCVGGWVSVWVCANATQKGHLSHQRRALRIFLSTILIEPMPTRTGRTNQQIVFRVQPIMDIFPRRSFLIQRLSSYSQFSPEASQVLW